MVKVCITCRVLKEESQFNNDKNQKDKLSKYCRECTALHAKKHYYKNKKQRVKNILESRKKRVERVRREINELKRTQGCYFCKENEPVCIDFHHLNSEKKEYLVSKMIGVVSKKKLEDEIKKCITVCANCHRKLHKGLINYAGVPERSNGPDL